MAVVEQGAEIGPGTMIWHFSHVRRGAHIGRECMLGKGSYVAEDAWIGDRVRIQNNVSVFNGVRLENDVFVGPAVVFTNDRYPRACNLMDPDFRSTHVCHGATLGAGCIIVCGIRIGEFAMIGAGAVVTADVPAYACVVGNPAHQIGWSCRCGRPLRLIETDSKEYRCSACGRKYLWQVQLSADKSCPCPPERLEPLDHDFDV
jgi:UDP-2-acetamido-3-amino-2,3-dideoxy-glucuronate N-acetyltransferase